MAVMDGALYDRIGGTYTGSRRPDPRIAAAIRSALGDDVRTVVNVGAGTGGYEPADLDVVPVEPSEVMNGQRPGGAGHVIRATAEALPFGDESFDAAMAIFSDHHWTDRAAGLRELRRVARGAVVLLNFDPALSGAFWLSQEYLPGATGRLVPEHSRVPGFWQRELEDLLGEVELLPVPIPHDCTDGFYGAYWRRPHAYLDPTVRSNISVFQLLAPQDVDRAIARLAADLESGAWHERHADLLDRDALDLGYRLVVARPG
jgi:SAM-dependent methyltransferase